MGCAKQHILLIVQLEKELDGVLKIKKRKFTSEEFYDKSAINKTFIQIGQFGTVQN